MHFFQATNVTTTQWIQIRQTGLIANEKMYKAISIEEIHFLWKTAMGIWPFFKCNFKRRT